ncbi:Uncharacterised protein [Mycobacteroides abscessus subsp. abscessus]|nr:Uncharacterised protein [Mycobacteroides abscessus subsp. abscessus]
MGVSQDSEADPGSEGQPRISASTTVAQACDHEGDRVRDVGDSRL